MFRSWKEIYSNTKSRCKSDPFCDYLDVIQHQLLLCIVHGTVGAFKNGNFKIGNMLIKMQAEQGLQSEHCIAHGAFINQPERQKMT